MWLRIIINLVVALTSAIVPFLPWSWGWLSLQATYWSSGILVTTGLVVLNAAMRHWAQRTRDEDPEPEAGQPTCTLERIEGSAPDMRGNFIEIAVSIRSLTGEGDIIGLFSLHCEPKRSAEWRQGGGHGDVFENLGGLCQGDVVPGDRPLAGTVFFRLDDDWFDTATLALDLQYGPRVKAEPFDRSEVIFGPP